MGKRLKSHYGISGRSMISTKRIYDNQGTRQGVQFLVERLWPRGIKKENLHLDAWLKEAAPSQSLRKWFDHDPEKWEEFQRRYQAELDSHAEAWQPILDAARQGDVTLLYSARDTEHNCACVLMEYVQKHLRE
jgi:uncharacterized protein YeaO (DUF488 family)